jgi:hypothetical protein
MISTLAIVHDLMVMASIIFNVRLCSISSDFARLSRLPDTLHGTLQVRYTSPPALATLDLGLKLILEAVMPRWYEVANEASFKLTPAGHVFQAPSPWIFARSRYYLVSDAQKAELLAGLRRWRLLLGIAIGGELFLLVYLIRLKAKSKQTKIA